MASTECLKCDDTLRAGSRTGLYVAAREAGWARYYRSKWGTGFVCPTCRTTLETQPCKFCAKELLDG